MGVHLPNVDPQGHMGHGPLAFLLHAMLPPVSWLLCLRVVVAVCILTMSLPTLLFLMWPFFYVVRCGRICSVCLRGVFRVSYITYGCCLSVSVCGDGLKNVLLCYVQRIPGNLKLKQKLGSTTHL